MALLSQFDFKGNQEKAVTDPARAIAVIAGAGSGKTLSLVGRYLYLLEQGYPIRSILAITFTEKAAREMRSRIRRAVLPYLDPRPKDGATDSLPPVGEGPGVRGSIDSARIGTIHGLCAEILRNHPAEAELDPAFEVLEEGLASALQAEAVGAALAWAACDTQVAALFEPFKENELRQILNALMGRRLDVDSLLPQGRLTGPGGRAGFESMLASYLAEHLDASRWTDDISSLSMYRSTASEDKLELARRAVLAHWNEIQQARAARQWDAVLASLVALRKAISTQGQKNNWDNIETVRELMKDLRDMYDDHFKFLAEKSRFFLDEQVAAHLPAVYRLFEQTCLEYGRIKGERQTLDFDDLESLAARPLIENPDVRAQTQSELRAVLVDEFQDTNDRQRQIVYALTGFSPDTNPLQKEGSDTPVPMQAGARVDLFIVGDSKQSIYRFRQADVTVFRQVQSDIQSAGGRLIDLNLTFRAHKSLVESLNFLLSPILGEADDPARPYLVPFAPLRAYRQKPERENIRPPFIEFHLGLGENAEEGRFASAQALAGRLGELHQNEGFAWGDMALLFRSSIAFPVYEFALEVAGIPFLTIAGRGFYERPEIRDLLNALSAIADPTDDLALAGFLRSPAFAIPDSELYRLRFPENAATPVKLFDSLKQNAHWIGAQEHTLTGASVVHSYEVLAELHSLSGRAPAAAVLKRFLDLTRYRAILSTHPNGARLVRNVDKLLADAHRSRLVSLPDFLAYVQSLRDVSFREGEAPADSSTAGAVQLMTVHKAKGLEFPLTVIADASYEHRGNSPKIQLAHTLLLDLRADDLHPTAWQLAARREADLQDAEDRRLLYVAATRAREKLLVSGYVKQKKDGLELRGWLGKFTFLEMAAPEHPLLEDGIYAAVYPYSHVDASDFSQPVPASPTEHPRASDLLSPLTPAPPQNDEKTRARESDPPRRVWRIVAKTESHAPAWLVGRLVHESLRRWHFPDADFETFLRPFALESGLTDEAQIRTAIQGSRRMLERLRAHPLFNELDAAERHHEVPYYLSDPDGRGIIDLLYRSASSWCIIDFKTDEVHSEEEARGTIRRAGYDRQLARYAEAIEKQLKIQARTRLVFLNVDGEVKVFE
jgi:ATP-dependent helicase/nuclease subunit A